MREACFYYFGCVLSAAEIRMLMLQKDKDDFYVYVLEQGLQYRRVGHAEDSFRIVIGKELECFTDKNPYNLDKERPYTEMYEIDYKPYELSLMDRIELQRTLYIVGCYEMPTYWATYNYMLYEGEEDI